MRVADLASRKEKWRQVYSRKAKKAPWLRAEVPAAILRMFYEHTPSPKEILDYGCGNGRLALVLNEMGAIVTAADCVLLPEVDREFLSRGRYVCVDSLEIFGSYAFDGVLMWALLHHYPLADWVKWVEAAIGCLRPSGTVLIGCFSRDDAAFAGKPTRMSETTGDACFSTTEDLLAEVFAGAGLNAKTGTVFLLDGSTSAERKWVYGMAVRDA